MYAINEIEMRSCDNSNKEHCVFVCEEEQVDSAWKKKEVARGKKRLPKKKKNGAV